MTTITHLQSIAAALKPKAVLTKATRLTKAVWVLEERLPYENQSHNAKVLLSLGDLEQYVERREKDYIRIAIPRE
jgi:hypothetical protein